MKRLFISYSRTDREFAERLATRLAEMSADVWIDYGDIQVAAQRSAAVQEGLDTSDGMLLIISPDAVASHAVEEEWKHFMERKLPVIPVLWGEAKIPGHLHNLPLVDFSLPLFDSAFDKLLTELQRQGLSLEDAQLPKDTEDTSVFPTMHAQRVESVEAPARPAEQRDMTLLVMAGALALLMGLVALGFYIISFYTQQAPLSDFAATSPLPLRVSETALSVYPEMDTTSTVRVVQGADFIVRLVDPAGMWYEMSAPDGSVGYQLEEGLNLPPELLRVVPLRDWVDENQIILYTRPETDAPRRTFAVQPYPLLYGYLYNDQDDLWYRASMRDENGAEYIGWANHTGIDFRNLLPYIGYTAREANLYRTAAGSESIVRLSAESEVLVMQAQDRLLAAVYADGQWVTGWLESDALAVHNEALPILRD